MEILKGHSGSVKFVVPDNLTSGATFKVFRGETQIGSSATATVAGGVATCPIPYAAVQTEGDVKVVLDFTMDTVNYKPEKVVQVITPYLDLYEVKSFLSITDNIEAAKAEAAVRHVINAHCGQDFGRLVEARAVRGSGTRTLALPGHLMSLTTINESEDIDYFKISGGGFNITYYPLGVPPVKADYHGLHQHVGGVIHNPYNVDYGRFRKGAEYRINGEWGYPSVPEPIRQAAELLLGVYADDDTEYRDRYLTSMTAADWRIQFQDGAFVQTGHVRADQLLSDYVMRRGWAVL